MNTPMHKPSQDDEDPITRPIHDEWGVYDPEQAGFEAILKKLSSRKKTNAPVPDQARPKPAAQPADDDSGIWMPPTAVLKPDSK